MPAYEHPVRVNTVRRAGKQCTIVLPFLNSQIRKIRRLYDADLVYFIGQSSVQDIQLECVPNDQLIKICKEPCLRQPAVAGQHAMTALASDRQTCAGKMTHSILKNLRIRCVIERKFHIDLLNLDISHDSRSINIKFFFVCLDLLFAGHPVVSVLCYFFIVCLCTFPDLFHQFRIQLSNIFRISEYSKRMMVEIVPVADRRVCN